MKTASNRIIIAAALALAAMINSISAQPLTLTGTSYFQNFDNIGTGLPNEWTVRTPASATSLGAIAPFTSVHKDWDTTTGSFANYASATNLVGNESPTIQTNALNRAAGVRQTGAFGDPGAAFVLRIQDTLGFGNFALALDFQNLSPQGRTTVWSVDYAVGGSPNTFYPVGTYTNWGTNTALGVFDSTRQSVSFGTALNNQPENVWIRIVALSPTTGVQNRGTFAIDDFDLSWENVAITVAPPEIFSQPQNRTNDAGTTATFTVGVIGTAPLTFQWKKGVTDILDGPTAGGSTISGASTATLTISSARTNDAGNYSVYIQNSADDTNSAPAILAIVQAIPIATNIAYLRTKMDSVDYTPSDTTNLYSAEGIVTTPVNLTTVGNAQFYMQDDTAGIAVFVSGGSTIRPAQGDRVRVIGPLGHFNGLFELNLVAANFNHSVEILSSGNPVPVPANFNFSTYANIPVMEGTIEGSLLVISNVFLQSGGGTFGSGLNYHMTNLSGQVSLQGLRIDTRATNVIGKAIPVFAASIKGVMGQFIGAAPFTTGYQFFLTLESDIVAGTPPTAGPSPVPLTIALQGTNVVLTWPGTSPAFGLYGSPGVSGTYTNIPGAQSPYTNSIGSGGYFQLRYP